jgi:hypothetical protein
MRWLCHHLDVRSRTAAAGPIRNEADLSKPRPSVLKRQREQAKREKKAQKAEKSAFRKTERETRGPEDDIQEQPLPADQD